MAKAAKTGVLVQGSQVFKIHGLEIHSGEVLVLRGELSAPAMQAMTKGIQEHLAARGVTDVLIVYLGESDITLDLVDEAEMARYGWARAPKEPS
jgi:hypothetical protein